MKNIEFTVEFTTHVLALGFGPKGDRDHFQRDSHGRIIFQPNWFHSAFTRAMEIAKVRGIKASDIQMDLLIDAPTQVWNRKYGQDAYRDHEAILPGSVVTFHGIVADSITESVMRLILTKLGSYVGLSPYGYKLGYGHFSLNSVTVEQSDAEVTV